MGVRESILRILRRRFELSETELQEVSKKLEDINSFIRLYAFQDAALNTSSVEEFFAKIGID